MNYRQIYAMKAQREKRIEKVCAGITNNSGIYIFHRIDENGIKHAYCGQAVHLKERCASHLAEYDHIALSLKKRGFYVEGNEYGWKLAFKECSKDKLDENEIATIKNLANDGFQMLNVSAGGQGKGKNQLNDYKQPKTYMQGIEQGKKNASKEIAHLFEKHLAVSTKSDPPTVNQQKALQKFNDFLEYHKGDSNNGE